MERSGKWLETPPRCFWMEKLPWKHGPIECVYELWSMYQKKYNRELTRLLKRAWLSSMKLYVAPPRTKNVSGTISCSFPNSLSLSLTSAPCSSPPPLCQGMRGGNQLGGRNTREISFAFGPVALTGFSASLSSWSRETHLCRYEPTILPELNAEYSLPVGSSSLWDLLAWLYHRANLKPHLPML